MSIEAVQYPTFQRAMRIITNITQGFPALVTTSFAHQYETGMSVRIIIPWNNTWITGGVRVTGMTQINGQEGTITVVNPTQFTIDIDTTNYNQFALPPDIVLPDGTPTQLQYAQVVPIGELNDMLTSATQNVLPYP